MASKGDDGSDYRPPQSGAELLERYAKGERYFGGASLSGAELAGTVLLNLKLNNANLANADLTGANLANSDLSDADLNGTTLIRADLFRTSLVRARLRDVHLFLGNLSEADMTDIDAGNGDLIAADLTGAKLIRADLSHADLTGAKLIRADLSHADLRGAKLNEANLRGAQLVESHLGGAKLSASILSDIDMSALCNANPPVAHGAPSGIDFDSIVRTIHNPRLEGFLAEAGVPPVAIRCIMNCAQSISEKHSNSMRSTFISYGSPDEAFAKKLYEALHKNGVRVFLFSQHAEPGEKLHRMMRKGVTEHDRVVLICSKDSLNRNGVVNEIFETLAREARDGGIESYLIPIRLDGYVFTGWKPSHPDVATAIRSRVIADFEGTETDDAKFAVALSKLLRALTKKPGPTTPSGGASP